MKRKESIKKGKYKSIEKRKEKCVTRLSVSCAQLITRASSLHGFTPFGGGISFMLNGCGVSGIIWFMFFTFPIALLVSGVVG